MATIDVIDEEVILLDDVEHPYYDEIIRIKQLVETYFGHHLPNFDINTYVDSAAPPDIFRMEIRPAAEELRRNANFWVNMYVSSCYGNGDTRRGEALKLNAKVAEEISAPCDDYNTRMVETYGGLVGEVSELLGGDCPEFHTNFEVFLTAAFAVPKPVQQTRLIIVVGMNLTVKDIVPKNRRLF